MFLPTYENDSFFFGILLIVVFLIDVIVEVNWTSQWLPVMEEKGQTSVGQPLLFNTNNDKQNNSNYT